MMSTEQTTAEALLRANGLNLPPGHTIVSMAERPDLVDAGNDHNIAVWPKFMLEDEVADRLFGRAFRNWAQFQFVLLDSHGGIAATSNAMPLCWDGSDDGLPEGWDDQVIRSVADTDAGRPLDTLGAMQIVVKPGLQGSGFSGTMVGAMRVAARAVGYRAVIACVRPTWKDRYPLTSIERYAGWTRDDGLPFDPWIRLHVRLGGRIVRASPRSMMIRGSVADWEKWTGMAFPESGRYVLTGATSPVAIDGERDEGVYYDENVWIVHDLG